MNSNFGFDAALEALLSPLHQSRTADAIAKAAERRTVTVQDMRYYWNKVIRYGASDVDDTAGSWQGYPSKIIHITGTKGKGSTACMCEAILRRHYGLNTALFTSPHLVDIRERIRVNGLPVPKAVFAHAYWTVRRRLETQQANGSNAWSASTALASTSTDTDADTTSVTENTQQAGLPPPPTLPGYFRMLTLMALYIFTHCKCKNKDGRSSDNNSDSKINRDEKPIDVLILEVGMGGRYDATNFIDHKLLCQTKSRTHHKTRIALGVTMLDFDHCRILGNTLTSIAWEKGGIFSWYDKAQDDETEITPRPSSSSEEESMPTPNSDKKRGIQALASPTETTSAFRISKATRTLKNGKSLGIEGEEGQDESQDQVGQNMLQLSDDPICNFFTLSSIPADAMSILRSCARIEGRGGILQIIDAQGKYIEQALFNMDPLQPQRLGLAGSHQYGNAALALSLCRAVTGGNDNGNDNERSDKNDFQMVPASICDALISASWPGRCQTVAQNGGICLHLDGAHTPQSLHATMEWYDYCVQSKSNLREAAVTTSTAPCTDHDRPNILVFYCSHERNPVELFQTILHHGGGKNSTNQTPHTPDKEDGNVSKHNFTTSDCFRFFSDVYFCPPDSQRPSPITPLSARELLENAGIPVQENKIIQSSTWQTTLASIWLHMVPDYESHRHANDSLKKSRVVFDASNATEVLQQIQQKHRHQSQVSSDSPHLNGMVNVLVTGSLYLVGSVLTAVGWDEQDSQICI